ncbi:MAG: peptide deformylase [Bacteroidia bacterium]|nr:peptide deformylase [Bacteroidia bacterium]
MIYPIRAYGDPVLRAKCEEIVNFDEDLDDLIQSMYKTMDASDGVGLAAPQIGKALRIFMIDSTHFKDYNKFGVRQIFINPHIIEEIGEDWAFEEGCLSIPDVREDIIRKSSLKIRYQNQEGKFKEEVFDGMNARVIQHEYDHIEGVLFIDHISAFKRQLLKGKLSNISRGKINVRYRMKFPKRN